MEDVFEILSNSILYVALGFVFLKIYRLFVILPKTTDHEAVLTESLAIGFILKRIYDIPNINFNTYVDTMIMIVNSAILGLCFAKIVQCKQINNFLRKLVLKQTQNNFIWHDLLDKYAIHAQIVDYDNDVVYYGRIALIEAYNNHPQILLTEYEWYSQGELKDDFSEHPEQTVLIDTSKYKDIKLIFDSNGDVIKQWSKKDDDTFVKECIEPKDTKPKTTSNVFALIRDANQQAQNAIHVKIKKVSNPHK